MDSILLYSDIQKCVTDLSNFGELEIPKKITDLQLLCAILVDKLDLEQELAPN